MCACGMCPCVAYHGIYACIPCVDGIYVVYINGICAYVVAVDGGYACMCREHMCDVCR